MTMTYRAEFRCPTCGTLIRFEDERPPWRKDVRQVALMEEAKQWCSANPDARIPVWSPDPEIGRFSSLLLMTLSGTYVAKVRDDLDLRVFNCPACEGIVSITDRASDV